MGTIALSHNALYVVSIKMINACACMGIRPGDEYCYCQLKARGMDISHYEWSDEEKQRLKDALEPFFEINRIKNG